jgi:hypothetical protein
VGQNVIQIPFPQDLSVRQVAYRKFLQSPFWKSLRADKIRRVRRCEKCRWKKGLQAHHINYPADWFQTTLDDLQVLCKRCHRIEHGLLSHREIKSGRGRKRLKAKACATHATRAYRKFCAEHGIDPDSLNVATPVEPATLIR